MKDLIILVNLGGLTREADKLQRGHRIAKEIWGLSVRLTRPSQDEAREAEPFGGMLARSLQPEPRTIDVAQHKKLICVNSLKHDEVSCMAVFITRVCNSRV